MQTQLYQWDFHVAVHLCKLVHVDHVADYPDAQVVVLDHKDHVMPEDDVDHVDPDVEEEAEADVGHLMHQVISLLFVIIAEVFQSNQNLVHYDGFLNQDPVSCEVSLIHKTHFFYLHYHRLVLLLIPYLLVTHLLLHHLLVGHLLVGYLLKGHLLVVHLL